MERLTETRIQTLIREGTPVVIAVGDGSGLCFVIPQISKAGQPVKIGKPGWKLRYRHGGKAHWLTNGRYSEQLGLKEAKKEATKQRARIDAGVDPVGERRRSKLALRAAKTVVI